MVSSAENNIEVTSVLNGHYRAEYMGGHPEHPSRAVSPVSIYSDKIEVDVLGLEIPYRSMTNIENMDEQRISTGRVVGLGLLYPELAVVGALWKKKHRYTVLQYKDGVENRAIVLDFRNNIDSAQPLIYGRMLNFRKVGNKQLSGDFFTYENNKYGFRIQYPFHWVKDELWEKSEDYDTLVEFRETLEAKPPFVTIYGDTHLNPNISLKEYIDKEVNNSSIESIDVDTIQLTETQIGNNLAYQMFFMEGKTSVEHKHKVKNMAIWTKIEDKICEIVYSARHEQFMKYLPLVEKMKGSFQFINKKEQKSNVIESIEGEIGDKDSSSDDPLLILKRRFARGEITEGEYLRMRKILEN
jgi:hypothetical protein